MSISESSIALFNSLEKSISIRLPSMGDYTTKFQRKGEKQMKAVCTKCGQPWNVSVHKNLKLPFVCPHCACKARIKKLILYVVGFIISCLLVPLFADMAYRQRGYKAYGGEMLIPLLYVVIVGVIKEFFKIIKKESTYKALKN